MEYPYLGSDDNALEDTGAEFASHGITNTASETI